MTGRQAGSRADRDATRRSAVGAVAGIVMLLVVSYVVTGFPANTDVTILSDRGVLPDVFHERATAWEAIWGDPYRPVGEILEDHGYPRQEGAVSPRPPSALLLQTPLLLIPKHELMMFAVVSVLALLIWVGRLTQVISGVRAGVFVWAIPLLVISLPVVASLSYLPLLGLLSVALILAAWRFQDRPWAGILLGVAAALRLWPGLVMIGFWIAGRRSLARKALVTFVGLTLGGLLLPSVDLGSSIASLGSGGSEWLNHNQNSSLALVLWPYGVPAIGAVLLASSAGVVAAHRNRAYAVPITIVAGLIASPLSWPTYMLAAVPAAALYARIRSPLPVLALTVPVALWILLPSRWVGHLHFFVLLALLALLASGETVDIRDTEDSRSRRVVSRSVSG